MFFKKMREQIERLQWKVRSLEEDNKDLRDELNRALQIIRSQLLHVKKGEPVSDEAIEKGLGYNVVAGEDVPVFLKRNPDAVILDVRTQQEFQLGHLPNAIHIPIDQLGYRVEELKQHQSKPVISYCASGARAEVACELLTDHRFAHIYLMTGGIGAYPEKLEVPSQGQTNAPKPEERDLTQEEQEIHDKVKQVLDQEINPAVAAHGGVINLLDVRGRDVFVHMGGGCQGCGMAAQTLRQGVEESLRKAVPHMGSLYDITDHAQGKNPYYGTAS